MFELRDIIFQGMVLGPLVWVLFSLDLPEAIVVSGAMVELFADDVTVYKSFDRKATLADIFADMKKCQSHAHEWGRYNQAQFAESKEAFVTLSNTIPKGQYFFACWAPLLTTRFVCMRRWKRFADRF